MDTDILIGKVASTKKSRYNNYNDFFIVMFLKIQDKRIKLSK